MNFKYKNIFLCLAILLIVIANIQILHTRSEVDTNINPVVKTEEPTISEMVADIAPKFNQDPKLIEKIIYCESGGKVQSHDGGRGFNITGIHDTTFNYWLKEYQREYHETLNKDSTYDQIKMMSFAFSKGESYRKAWSTYRAYINGGKYSFYSNELKDYFTVNCQ